MTTKPIKIRKTNILENFASMKFEGNKKAVDDFVGRRDPITTDHMQEEIRKDMKNKILKLLGYCLVAMYLIFISTDSAIKYGYSALWMVPLSIAFGTVIAIFIVWLIIRE